MKRKNGYDITLIYGGINKNHTRIATIEAAEVYDAFGGCWYFYTWLVSDNTDNDSDGIFDYLETNGVMGTNRHWYYANPNKTDSDDDTLSDKDEIGAIYELSRSADGRSIFVRIDNELVFASDYGVIPLDSYYAFLNDYFDMIPNGGSISICVPKSDARIPDSDEDGYSDSEDARPVFVNTTMNYFLSSQELMDESLLRLHKYRAASLLFHFEVVDSTIDFVFEWSGIGLFDDYYKNGYSVYGNKYYYDVNFVVISAHGCPKFFELGTSEEGPSYRISRNGYMSEGNYYNRLPRELMGKKIQSLVLLSCSAGASYDGGNIAQSFADISGIQCVIAPDSELVSYVGRGCDVLCCYSYNNVCPCSWNEYQHLRNTVFTDSYIGRMYFCECYSDYSATRGFLVFHNSIDEPYELYDDDVITGDLYIPQSNIDNNRSGIIIGELDFSSLNNVVMNDPVLIEG